MSEKLSERMREYLFRLSEREPVTMPEIGWPDEVAALESELALLRRVVRQLVVHWQARGKLNEAFRIGDHNRVEAAFLMMENTPFDPDVLEFIKESEPK